MLAQLERGEIETATLAETLAVDFAKLARSVFASLPRSALADINANASQGVTKRMHLVAQTMITHLSPDEITSAAQHPSDIVRGWAAYALPNEMELDAQLQRARIFAADAHFGVREWAWLAVRPAICEHPQRAIDLLVPWAHDNEPFIRRFASEATRPRGVWATHLTSLKADPSPAWPILDPLCLDADDYVHRSVGNWLRDAAKTAFASVEAVLDTWEQTHGSDALLDRLRRRALG